MPALVLRDYQNESVEKCFQFLREMSSNGVLELPTGAGKTPVGATITRRIVEKGGRVLLVTHVKELLEQMYETMCKMLPEYASAGRIGLYSAGLNSRDTDHDILIAGVQSIYKRANQIGIRHLTIVDEAHLIPPNGDGMYQTLINDLKLVYPKSRLVGLTATPYRLTSGVIYGEGQVFEKVIHRVDVKDLIGQGFLSPLVGCAEETPDLDGLHLRGGEYIASELDEVYNESTVVDRAVNDLITKGKDRHHWLVFCVTIAHAHAVCDKLIERGIKAACITSETKKKERAAIINDYKLGKYQAMINVGVLTTGFDAPMIDLIAIMRSTKSPGLYCQILGRGFRLHPSKKDCMILDFGNNIREHGPVDAIKPPSPTKARGKGELKEVDPNAPKGKICPQCDKILEYKDTVCVACGYEYPANHESLADTRVNPLSSAVLETWPIEGINCEPWAKKGVPAMDKDKHPDTMMVTWYATGGNVREWICVGHKKASTFAFSQAKNWWKQFLPDTPMPMDAKKASELFMQYLRDGLFSVPHTMEVIVGGKYPELRKLNFPESPHSCRDCMKYNDTSGYCEQWKSRVPAYNIPNGCNKFDGVPF